MPKPDIHPTWYPDAKVICNGEVVMTTGSTQPEITLVRKCIKNRFSSRYFENLSSSPFLLIFSLLPKKS